jgi:hypothetical protein
MPTDSPQSVQVDGDVIGHAHGIRAGLHPDALPVRQPVTMSPEHQNSTAAPGIASDETLQPA